MGSCCHNKEKDLEKTVHRHKVVLWTVLVINLMMFGVEFGAGILANSLSLIGDSLDMLGDAITYGSSIMVVGLSTIKKAKVARLKAWIMLTFAAVILLRCMQKVLHPEVPDFFWMFSIGSLALVANLFCLWLLTSHKEDDINMRSVWVCSRNDIIANSSVLVAAALVLFTASAIPDIVVGIGLTILFTKSAFGIFHDVRVTLSGEEPKPACN